MIDIWTFCFSYFPLLLVSRGGFPLSFGKAVSMSWPVSDSNSEFQTLLPSFTLITGHKVHPAQTGSY